jgi:hypothetical protein
MFLDSAVDHRQLILPHSDGFSLVGVYFSRNGQLAYTMTYDQYMTSNESETESTISTDLSVWVAKMHYVFGIL